MSERTVVVASSVGLHARPAALFSQAAAQTSVPVMLTTASGRSVNAASILGVLSLGIDHGERVTLSSDDEAALEALAAMLERDLDLE
ncbi:HPr family phosphocarrier protein [Protaetiibacter mangrovi]|uniref:Phosphocarrier protein HPr n=1 Tax=Protaetiibacter mangrovi TaxID=2970926 RepID=A0ABT1ZBZ4_9MICO|nr:HPr family phosphocarrier protein [Protaetiibacter mangrovi]MCS0498233.1 HPr family phosphocarrier protein [Protaetiibacter mangrovi]TPX00634.1 HPr family phosphocarrier protein [Schumannella luteola]